MKSFIIILSMVFLANCQSNEAITTVSGTHAPARGSFNSGDLIFEEVFEQLDFERWQHENTLAGGGNWEFQWYQNNRSNTYTEDGILHIKPTLMEDEFGPGFISSATLNVHGGTPADQCTNAQFWGCERQGNPNNIINPIKSARLRTVHSFNFRYGTLEIRAKLPAGDWLWPAIWLMPKVNAYGSWPSSGEIDLMESRGNRQLFDDNDTNVGVEQVGQTLHFGPRWDMSAWPTAHFQKNQPIGTGFDENFHTYRMVWTNESITFFVDGEETGLVEAGDGFWARGGFTDSGRENPWQRATPMAPFDQEFYIIMNLAVGGTTFFADGFRNEPTEKPWLNTSPRAAADFWQGRNDWLPTWNMGTDSSHLQVDYVRVWAV